MPYIRPTIIADAGRGLISNVQATLGNFFSMCHATYYREMALAAISIYALCSRVYSVRYEMEKKARGRRLAKQR
jgi:hypothetical protein